MEETWYEITALVKQPERDALVSILTGAENGDTGAPFENGSEAISEACGKVAERFLDGVDENEIYFQLDGTKATRSGLSFSVEAGNWDFWLLPELCRWLLSAEATDITLNGDPLPPEDDEFWHPPVIGD